jgi:acetyl-CoA carboxylase carboxyl transferase subunit alpha
MHNYLDFEKPISDLEGKILELRKLANEDESVDTGEEIARLETRARDAMAEIYGKLNPWQKTQVARHPARPHFQDYAKALFDEFTPLAGDRKFAEDAAIQAGFARFRGQPVVVDRPGKGPRHQDPHPPQFRLRPARRLSQGHSADGMADRFEIPVVTLIDTAGAYPGVGAEERGQAEAIARSTETCLNIRVPLVSDRYRRRRIRRRHRHRHRQPGLHARTRDLLRDLSEGAASILWRDATRAKDAATSMKITAQDLLDLGIIDGIIPEPVGGAHRDPDSVMSRTGDIISGASKSWPEQSGDELRSNRRKKFLKIGRQIG